MISEKDIAEVEKAFLTRWKFIQSKIGDIGSKSVLEVGAGCGGLLSLMRKTERATDYLGLEPDSDRFELIDSHFGEGFFLNLFFEEFKPEKKYA